MASDGDGREDDGSPTRMVVEIRVHESTPRERLWRPPGKSKVIAQVGECALLLTGGQSWMDPAGQTDPQFPAP